MRWMLTWIISTKKMSKNISSCENCLFFVEPYPSLMQCIGGRGIYELKSIKTDCKRWVEDTKENAVEWLKKHKEGLK